MPETDSQVIKQVSEFTKQVLEGAGEFCQKGKCKGGGAVMDTDDVFDKVDLLLVEKYSDEPDTLSDARWALLELIEQREAPEFDWCKCRRPLGWKMRNRQ